MNRLVPPNGTKFLKNSVFINRIISTTMSQSFLVTKKMSAKYFDKVSGKYSMDMWEHSHEIPREELLKRVKDKSAIFCTLVDKIDAQLLDAAGPKLKTISTLSVGYDHIDVDECRKRNICVGNTPDVLTDAVAELTISLLLATLRRLFEANKALRQGVWPTGWGHFFMCGGMVKNSTIGFIGSGRIATSVLKKLRSFEPSRIVYTSRNHSKTFDDLQTTYVSLEELLRQSDIVIVCCSLNDSTRHLLSEKQFKMMKPTAILVNSSRGAIINQKDLYDALQAKVICAAGLDVMEVEPISTEDPLLKLDNAVLLPHIGSATYTTREAMIGMAVDNLEAGLDGRPLVASVCK